MGASKPLLRARAAIQAESRHSYSRVQAREAVAGGNSQQTAYGSAFSTTNPSTREVIRYLYAWPRCTAATAPSQMPEPSQRAASMSSPARQPFHSPTTETAAALGAQTAKCAPPPGSSMHPSLECSCECV